MSVTAYPPRERPLLVYDGECSFCRRWAARWQRWTGERIAYEPFQSAAARFPDIPIEHFQRSVHLIQPDGAVYSGAAAVYALCATRPRWAWLLWAYRRVPGFARVSEWAYREIAAHR